MATYENLSYSSDDGCIVNTSSEPVGFFGKTPTSQSTCVVTATSTTPVSTSGIYGFTETQAQSIIDTVLELQRKGLIA